MEEIKQSRIIKPPSRKIWLKERLSRFRPVVFLKKNLPIFLFLLLLLISFLVGLWNIKNFEILEESGGEIDENVSRMVEEYLKKNVKGKNFFLIHSNKLGEDLVENIPFIKFASVSKNVPNSILIVLDVLTPEFVAYTGDNRCTLLSIEGNVLENLCEDEEDIKKCCENYHSEKNIAVFKSKDLSIAKLSSGKERLLVMETLSKVIKVIRSFDIKVKEITLSENVVDFKDQEDRITRFTLSDEIEVQLARYFIVMGKIKSEKVRHTLVDVRFKRPVVKTN
ncbi:TPA: hypothetical protein GX533_01660 [Candidatus Dojkabacteria bacterium]|jgi:hypothetical protein|uniref:FtsQ-type POTRA domain-containing protein n=1 Tax=Candidatus Dojkabacteria bacterium TaxID=2099670 RepID=A0A832QDW4_9BACT|nr:hypothetical protein [Candidatus Dojkabacteria bacterium]